MMRAFILLAFFGWAVAAENINASFNCQGCFVPLEESKARSPSSREPEKKEENHVPWNGTRIPVGNGAGFPPKPDDKNNLQKTKVQKHRAAFNGARRRRVASPPASNWNPLQTDLRFESEENENKLNATAVVPQDGSNATTNATTNSTVTLPPYSWHPLKNNPGFKQTGNEKRTNEGNAQTEKSKTPTPTTTLSDIWHPLTNRAGFQPEGTKDQDQKQQD